MEVKLANDWLISAKRNAIVVYIHVNNFSAVSLIWWWCLEYHGRLYFIVHPHCMKCCSTQTLYPTYTRTHFTDFETIGHCCYFLLPQGPWFDPIWGSNTYLLHSSSECLPVHLTGVVFGIHQNVKSKVHFRAIYIAWQYVFSTKEECFFFRLKIVNEFLWENVRRIEFESTQGEVIRIRNSKDRQHNSQKKSLKIPKG